MFKSFSIRIKVRLSRLFSSKALLYLFFTRLNNNFYFFFFFNYFISLLGYIVRVQRRKCCNKIRFLMLGVHFIFLHRSHAYPDYLGSHISEILCPLSGNSGAIYIDERRTIFREANWKTLEG